VFAVSLLIVTALSPLAFHDFGSGPWNRGGTDGYEDFELAAGPISSFANTNYFAITNATELSWVGDGKAHKNNNNNTSNIWSANANYYLANHIEFGSQDLNGNPNASISIVKSGANSVTLNVIGTVPQGTVVTYLCSSTGYRPYPTVFSGTSFPFNNVYDGTYTMIVSLVTAAGIAASVRAEINIGATTVTPSSVALTNGNFTPLPAFNGVFDGNGFEIRGMHTRSGLFGSVGDNGVVKNLGVVGGSSINPWGSAGGISGWGGTFINCYNGSTIEASAGGGPSAAGISASYGASGVFINCYNTGSVTARGYSYSGEDHMTSASGIGNGTATNCYNRGAISAISVGTGGAPMAGGISSWGHNLIANCYNTGTITGGAEYSGGIVGFTAGGDRVTVVNCYTSTSTVRGTSPYYDVFIDGGTANPARKTTTPNQASGTKNTTVMTPTLADAKANNSIYYTGTVTLSGVVVPGWDFNNVWTISPGVNNGYPTFISGNTVTTSLTNLTSNLPATVNTGATLSGTITPNTGYGLPSSVAVTMGGATVAASGYSYDAVTGAFSLANVTGNVVITATGMLRTYNVTTTLANLTSNLPVSVDHGGTVSGTITPSTGYGLPSSVAVTMGGATVAASGYSYDAVTGAFSLANVTGNVVVTASGMLRTYTITTTLTNLTSDLPASVNHGGTVSGTITPSTGYGLPSSVAVTMGGATVTPANYTYNSTSGAFSLTSVTGNVVITATGMLRTYTITTSLTNLTSDLPASVDHGGTVSGTITPSTGYDLPSSVAVMMGGATVASASYTYDSTTGTFSLANVTGDVVVTASGVRITYTVTTTLTNLTSNLPALVNHGGTVSGTIIPNTGHGLPSSITVMMDGTTVAPTDYTYDGTTGTFSLVNVTGNVVVTATGVLNTYTVTKDLADLSSDIPDTINHGFTLSGTISADTGYSLPLSITVTVNGTTIVPANYSYNSSTGAFSLPGAYVTGNVVITASGVPVYNVTTNFTDLSSNIPATVVHGTTLSGTISADTGYGLPTNMTVTVDGSPISPANYGYNSVTGVFTLSGAHVTGDVVIMASGVLNNYTVTKDFTGLVSDIPANINHGYTVSGTISTITGYDLPSSITVTMGGSTVDPADYIYNESTGAFSLVYVTGNVVITALGELRSYTVTNNVTDTVPASPHDAFHGTAYGVTLIPNPGFDLPVNITIHVAGTELTLLDDYVYDPSTGLISINGESVTGEITISGAATPDGDPAYWYKVTFDPDNGGSVWDEFIPVSSPGPVGKPADPILETFVFEGWFNGADEWIFTDDVTEDILLKAKWSHDLTDWWVVTFNPDNGEPTWDSYILKSPAGPAAIPPEPSKYTFVFDGWFNGADEWIFTENVTSDLTLTAHWAYDPAYWYTVTFDPNNRGSTWDEFILKSHAGPVGKPADPILETFVFKGWFNGADEWIFTDNVTSNMILTAEWSHDLTDWWVVTFDPDNGDPTWDSYILKSPPGPVARPLNPVKATYTFNGWFNGATAWDFGHDITSDLTLTVNWAYDPAYWYKVIFDPNNGESTKDVYVLRSPEGPVPKPADPILETFVFEGWFNGADEWIFTDNVTSNMILTAKWSEDTAFWWIVTFDPDNGEPTWDSYILKSPPGPAARPLNPVKADYLFDGWYNGGTEWIFTDNVTSNLTLTAEWSHDPEDWWIVTFDPNNGGSTWDDFVHTPAGPVAKPAPDPVSATYKFDGWFNGDSLWNFDNNVTSNIVLTAKWSYDPADWWVVTFNPDNGDPAWDVYVLKTPPGSVTRPVSPVKATYIFNGWFNGTTAWNFDNNVTGNMTLTVRWTHDPAYWHKVTFNPNNGSSTWDVYVLKSPEGPVAQPADPVLATYRFDGWYNGGSRWNFVNNVNSNMVLTASWSEDTAFWWIVTFDPDNGGSTWDVFIPKTPAGPAARPLDPVKSTYVFDGWFNGTTEWNFANDVGSNMTLKARWAHDPAHWYTVAFDADGGSPTPAPQYFLKSGINPYILRPADPVKAAYAVSGWTDGTKMWDFSSERVTSDITLTAVWVPDNSPSHWYEVRFNTDGGSTAPPSQYFPKIGTDLLVSRPPDPIKDMFIFQEWSDGTRIWDFGSDKVTSDMTLTAEWFHDPAHWYSVDVTGNNVVKSTTKVPHGQTNLQIIVSPAARYVLDAGISVKMGAVTLQRGTDYTYDRNAAYSEGTVRFLIPVSDSVVIEASSSHGGFFITGKVTDRSGVPLSGVVVTYTGGVGTSVVTGPSGEYSFKVPYGSLVTITSVALDGYNLYPVSQVPFYLGNVLSDRSGVNFSLAGKSGTVPDAMEHGKIEWFNGLRWVTLDGELELASGSMIPIRAVADPGYKFTGWIGVDGTTSTIMLTVDGTTKNIKATFEAI